MLLLVGIIAVSMLIVPISAEEVVETPDETVEEIPTDEPIVDEPITEPPTEEIPEETPPVETPPVETPPAETPDGEPDNGAAVEPTPDGTDEVVVDVFTRLWEFVETYSAEIASYATMAVMAIFAFYQKAKNGVFFTGIRKLLETQGDTRDITGEVFSSQKNFSDKLDAVSEQMAVLIEEIKADKAEIAELKSVIAANAVETMSVLEVLHIGYINNPNIPQSMKNLVTAKYAGLLTKINDDEGLKRAFKEMREQLGIGGDDEGEAD